LIGSVIKSRYLVQEKIGEGNLFTVYKCEDTINNRPVAMKVLLPQYASNRMFAERMLVEAQAMVGVSHPGIVEVYDCGEENGEYFVIIEFIRGLDLKERIRRGAPFTLSTAVDVCIAICDVLDFAHKRGFIHGDLRPGNIMVTSEGLLKVADFWVSSAVVSQQAVRTSTLMSSIHYMSPEVAEGKSATPAADIYSLGIILYELLTARLPFDGETPVTIALKHARDPIPSMRAINPAVPKPLEAVVCRALQKETEDRFRSAKSMLNELKASKDALHLAKPLVWSETGDSSPVEASCECVVPQSEDEQKVSTLLVTLKKVLIGVVIVIALLIVFAAYNIMNIPAEVKLPDLVGKPYTEALSMLSRNKVELVKRSEEYNEKYPEGTIFFMSPTAGRTIRSGKSVDVWVSKGSKYAKAPDLSKLSLEDAKQRIIDSGLNVGEISQDYDPIIPPACIIKQTPAPGTRLEKGQAVGLVFSLGPKPQEIPQDTTNAGDQSDDKQTSNDQTSDTSVQSKSRSFDLKLTVPPGSQDQLVEIKVQDDSGENTVYSEVRHPGDHIKKTVQGAGSKVVIRVYIDNKLIKEEQK